jgi:hypothetical protein
MQSKKRSYLLYFSNGFLNSGTLKLSTGDKHEQITTLFTKKCLAFVLSWDMTILNVMLDSVGHNFYAVTEISWQ